MPIALMLGTLSRDSQMPEQAFLRIASRASRSQKAAISLRVNVADITGPLPRSQGFFQAITKGAPAVYR